MLNEVFSDYFAQRKNFLTQVDARIKIIFVSAAILTVITSGTASVGLLVILLVLGALSCIRIPFKIISLRLGSPLGIALTLLIIKIFFYHEGLSSCLLIMSKIIGATGLILFLSMTTPLNKLLTACHWFKIPGAWIEICLISYRYIFVLLEDAITVFDAQRVRLGYTNWLRALRSIGALAGTIIIRAYDQSITTYEAMMLRGYRGKMQAMPQEERLTLPDALAAFISIAILISLLTMNHIFRL